VIDDTAQPPRCAACGVELAPGMVACPACRKLVHTDRLRILAAEAEAAEREGRLTDALTRWREALDLLPAGSAQHRTISETVRRLSEALDRSGGAAPAAKGEGAGRAAGLGSAAMGVWKLKFVVLGFLGKAKLLVTGLASLPTLLSMLVWLPFYGSGGVVFGVGLVASIYVHEMGHVAELRRFGIKATAPMFVPGLGALVRLHQYPIDAREDARVGLAGPVWGCAAALAALVLGHALDKPAILQVAALGATINLFNLIPVWQLDGSRGFRALDARQRTVVVGLAVLAALVLDQSMGWAVAAAGGFRLKRDLPAQGDRRAFWTFAALLVALSLLAAAGPTTPAAHLT
jgi:Zn-dependent protease